MTTAAPGPTDANAPPILQEVAEGLFALDLPVPFKGLRQINLWFLRDGAGWTMIDCGWSDAPTMARIEVAWAALPGGGPITRLIITHFHPDHAGNARWIAERWGIVPLMSAREWTYARMSAALEGLDSVPKQSDFFRRHGLGEEELSRYRTEFLTYDKGVFLPLGVDLLRDGDTLEVDCQPWTVLTGGGHSPEMVMLYSRERGILIAGDQLLPRISSNVSLGHWNPEDDVLQDYLDSLRRLDALLRPNDLVLPSHGAPFRDGGARARTLMGHHDERLDAIRTALFTAGRISVADMLPILFSRKLDGTQIGFAMGEVAAHFTHLVHRGEIAASVRADGLITYVPVTPEDADELQL